MFTGEEVVFCCMASFATAVVFTMRLHPAQRHVSRLSDTLERLSAKETITRGLLSSAGRRLDDKEREIAACRKALIQVLDQVKDTETGTQYSRRCANSTAIIRQLFDSLEKKQHADN